MDIKDINQLIETKKPKLILHALKAWETKYSEHSAILFKALQCQNPKSFEPALKLAAKYFPESSATLFIEFLKDSNATTRRLAIQSLCNKMGKTPKKTLANLLKKEKDVFVLASAVTKAAELDLGLEYIKPLMTHKDIRVRANAVRAATKSCSTNLRQIIEPMLQDSALRVQNEAIKGLAKLIPEHELERLLMKRLHSPSIQVRAATAYIAGELPINGRRVLLIEALNDKDSKVILCAIRALCAINDEFGIRSAVETFFNTDNSETQKSILNCLKKQDPAIFLALAEKHGDPFKAEDRMMIKILSAAITLTTWEAFLPWLLAATNRKSTLVRQKALHLIIERIDYFKSDLDKLLLKSELSDEVEEHSLCAYIRWKAGQLSGLERLKALLFSSNLEEGLAAANVLQLDKSIIARELLEEAEKFGVYPESYEGETKHKTTGKPIALPKE